MPYYNDDNFFKSRRNIWRKTLRCGLIGRVRDYLAMAMVILCGLSEVRNPAVRGTIVGVFHSTRKQQGFLRRIWHLLSILNLFRISPLVDAVNYRPYASPWFEVTSSAKWLPFRPLILLLLLLLLYCRICKSINYHLTNNIGNGHLESFKHIIQKT